MNYNECIDIDNLQANFAKYSLIDCWIISGRGSGKDEAICKGEDIYLYDLAEEIGDGAIIFYILGL
jgi:hypothetical protein